MLGPGRPCFYIRFLFIKRNQTMNCRNLCRKRADIGRGLSWRGWLAVTQWWFSFYGDTDKIVVHLLLSPLSLYQIYLSFFTKWDYLNLFQRLLEAFSTCFQCSCSLPRLLLITRPVRLLDDETPITCYQTNMLYDNRRVWSVIYLVVSSTFLLIRRSFHFSISQKYLDVGVIRQGNLPKFSFQAFRICEKSLISASSILTSSLKFWIHEQNISSSFIIAFPR